MIFWSPIIQNEVMTTYTDISILIERSHVLYLSLPEEICISTQEEIYFKLYRRRWNQPFLNPLKPEHSLSTSPEYIYKQDLERATILFFKVYIAWDYAQYRRYDLNPWDLIISRPTRRFHCQTMRN